MSHPRPEAYTAPVSPLIPVRRAPAPGRSVGSVGALACLWGALLVFCAATGEGALFLAVLAVGWGVGAFLAPDR